MQICSYCGRPVDKVQREHVFPSNLYPPSSLESKVQRLTIPACGECNNSWSDDEAHFRNVMVMSGDDPNTARSEIWEGSIARSFDQPDGMKRIDDLLGFMRPVDTKAGQRHKIFPAEDMRVMRVVRKVIRGLAHHHGLFQFVPDSDVWSTCNATKFPSSS